MWFKFGVKFDSLKSQAWFALGFIESSCKLVVGHSVTVTSLVDSEHKTQKHPNGEAIDIRTRDLSVDQRGALFYTLKAQLCPYGFDVVLEEDHIHIEWDPKGRQLFLWTE